MRSATRIVVLSAVLLAMVLAPIATSTAQAPLAKPVLVFMGQEFFEAGGKSWTRYRYNVDNFEAYPNTLFAAAPALPPCGANKNASRTWVDIFDKTGKRLNGFCALGKNADLNGIWFAREVDVVPPSWVYIEITDRQTNQKAKSNEAETTM